MSDQGASYESTGAAGTDYELELAAGLLVRVLAGSGDRSLLAGAIARSASLQRREGPRGFDDLTIQAEQPDGSIVPAYYQAKRTFNFAGEDFASYARAILTRDDDDESAEWSAVIVAGESRPPARDVHALTEAARAAMSSEDFESRWRPVGTLNAGKRAVLDALEKALGTDAIRRWRVLRRLVFVTADYDHPTSADRMATIDTLRAQLQSGSEAEAVLLYNELRVLALSESRISGTYDRAELLSRLRGRFSLRSLPTAQAALDILSAESQRSLATIEEDLGEVHLLRLDLLAECRKAREDAPVLRLVGEGGTGKSSVLRRLCDRADEHILFLKDDRISGRTWREYATSQGVSLSAEDIIQELSAEGPCLLALDGADRLLPTERRGVVLDLLWAISRSSSRDAWSIVSTARDLQDRDLVRDALNETGLPAGLRVQVGAILREDAVWLSVAYPRLSPILLREDFSERNRDLFTIRELVSLSSPENAITEVDLAALWAGKGGLAAPPAFSRDAAVAQIGEKLVCGGRLISSGDVDPAGAAALLQESTLRRDSRRDALSFTHDIYEDWAIARALDRRRSALADTLEAADQPLWWMRAVRLAAQIALEGSNGADEWRYLLAGFSGHPDLDPVWLRTIFVSPLYSERYEGLLHSLEPHLLEDDGGLLEHLIDTLLVFETSLDEGILTSDALEGYSKDDRRRLATAFRTPKGVSWRRFLRWSVSRWTAWPVRLLPKLAEIAHLWLRATEGWSNALSRELLATVLSWLIEIEDAEHPERWDDRRVPFGYEGFRHRQLEDVEKTLRRAVLYGAASGGNLIPRYLTRLATLRRLRGAAAQLLQMPRTLPQLYSEQYVDLAKSHFTPARPRVRDHGDFVIPIQRFSMLDHQNVGIRGDTGFFPSAPERGGFSTLFAANEVQALRLFRALEKRAAVTWRHLTRYEGRRPLPVILKMPWGEVPLWGDQNVFRWGRGYLGSAVLGSMYLALDEWLNEQAESGRPLEDLFRLVLRPHGLVATIVPCITAAIGRINSPGQIDAAGPIIAEPRLWSYDVRRYSDDLSYATSPLGFGAFSVGREAVIRVGQRYAKRQHLRNDLVLPFHVFSGQPARGNFYRRVESWTARDLAGFEDELSDAASMAEFERQLDRYRVDADPTNIDVSEGNQPGELAISIRPPEQVAQHIEQLTDQHNQFGALGSIWVWASRTLERGSIEDPDRILPSLQLVKSVDRDDLFTEVSVEDIFSHTAAQAVAGAAAVVATFGDDQLLQAEYSWVRSVLERASRTTRSEDGLYVDAAVLSADPQVFAARGLAALVARGRGDAAIVDSILVLAADRHHDVSTAAIASLDPQRQTLLTWATFKC